MLEIVYATQRLYARRWNPLVDAEAALAIYGDEEIRQYLSLPQPVDNLDNAIDFIQKRITTFDAMPEYCGYWAIELQDKREIVGAVLLKHLPDAEGKPTEDVEVGWHFRRNAWGNGYATEAASGAISFFFREAGLREINAIMYPENTRSVRVAERLGMQPLGMTGDYYGVECLLYRMHQEDWGVRH